MSNCTEESITMQAMTDGIWMDGWNVDQVVTLLTSLCLPEVITTKIRELEIDGVVFQSMSEADWRKYVGMKDQDYINQVMQLKQKC